MSATCPNGHLSQAEDFCDTCGAKIDLANQPAAAESSPSGAAPSTADPDPEPDQQVCPNCSTPNTADALFCEACGYDFTTGALPRGSTPKPDHSTEGTEPGEPGEPGGPGRVDVAERGREQLGEPGVRGVDQGGPPLRRCQRRVGDDVGPHLPDGARCGRGPRVLGRTGGHRSSPRGRAGAPGPATREGRSGRGPRR